MSNYDIAIIGGGPGGYVCAIRAAQLGLKTVCIEKNSSLGGACLNAGCIPSKTLLHSSEMFYNINNHGDELGIIYSNMQPDLKKMMQHKNKVIKNFDNSIRDLLKRNKIDHIQGEAEIITPSKIKVSQEDKISKIDTKYIVLATGSHPVELAQLPFDKKHVISSSEALSLSKIPKSMVVIGAGPIGLEIASIYNRLGTEVKVIEISDSIGGHIDNTIALKLKAEFEKQGIKFFLKTEVSRGKVTDGQISIMATQNKQSFLINGEIALVSAGRTPTTARLGLENIGVQISSNGFIPVDSEFRSSCSNIFAIGDLIEGPMLAHKASSEGTAVAEIISGNKSQVNYLIMPNVIYTAPEVAAVGLTEKEAKDLGLELKIGQASFSSNSRAHCHGETDGIVKIIAEANSEKIIGLHILGHNASEIITEGSIAMHKKLSLDDIINTTHPHPTLSEAIHEAALDAQKRKIHG